MLSAGASPSTSSPTGNYGLTKIAVAQVSVLLSTLKTKKDDPVEYDNRLERLKKVSLPRPIRPRTTTTTQSARACSPISQS